MSDNKNHLNQTSGVTVFKTKKCNSEKTEKNKQSKHNIFMLMQKMWLT